MTVEPHSRQQRLLFFTIWKGHRKDPLRNSQTFGSRVSGFKVKHEDSGSGLSRHRVQPKTGLATDVVATVVPGKDVSLSKVWDSISRVEVCLYLKGFRDHVMNEVDSRQHTLNPKQRCTLYQSLSLMICIGSFIKRAR